MSVSDMVKVLLQGVVYMSPQVYTESLFGVNVVRCQYTRNTYTFTLQTFVVTVNTVFGIHLCIRTLLGVMYRLRMPRVGSSGIRRYHLSRIVYILHLQNKP
jgi:hypothetical protein